MSIVIKGLSKKYGKQVALDNLSFTIEEKGIVGLLGPNGAGKSTTMKILTGVIEPTEGTAEIDGFSIEKNINEIKKITGYLPESNPLYPEMYVAEFLEFIAENYQIKNKMEAVKAVILSCGLQGERKKIIKQLSKGYKQRVGLAQAILHNPKILILDEPTSGLDANQLVEIRQLIKDLSKDKIIIFSSHIMQEVEALCDRVIILDKGKLVADNTIGELRNSLKGNRKITVEFENKPNQINEYAEIDPSSEMNYEERTIIFHTSEEKDIRPLIFATAVRLDDVIIEMKQSQTSFENIFQELTEAG